MAKVVIDASALLAYVNGEPGADKVEAVLGEAMISAVNLAEAATKLALKRGMPDRTLAEFTEAELAVIAFDRSLAEATGALAVLTRAAGLSLGDRACLALAKREGAIALTADNAWSKVRVGVDVRLIRSDSGSSDCTVIALSPSGLLGMTVAIDPLRAHPSRRSNSSTALSSTCAPAAHSSGVVDSASLCEMPPAQGTKIIVVGATRDM